jgi:hypothetical protein
MKCTRCSRKAEDGFVQCERCRAIRAARRPPRNLGSSPFGWCAICNLSFERVSNRLYCGRSCSDAARLSRHPNQDPNRPCRQCGAIFVRVGRGHANKQHCSNDCARKSAQESASKFKVRRPERDAIYREAARRRQTQKDVALARIWKRYPWMPRWCEGCAESRVLEIAHRPEFRLWGTWPTLENTTPEKIWILCPTCHALLDRKGFTKEQLGIQPRQSELTVDGRGAA